MKKVFLLVITILILGVALLIYILNQQVPLECAVIDEPQFICGTPNYTKSQSQGRSLFNSNCAACHKLDKNMSGPALRNIGQKYDSIVIVRYLKGNKSLIPKKDYNTDCVNFMNLTDIEIYKIIDYTSFTLEQY